jgi:hypothetical protein
VKKQTGLLAAVLLLLAVAVVPIKATAAPSAYEFTVTGTSGPLAGVTSIGTFSFDPAIVPEGPGYVNIAGVFESLSFSWDGVNYNEDSANTGTLGFDPDGTVFYALFGTNCGPSGYGCGVGDGASPREWAFNIDIEVGSVTGAFQYVTPTDTSNIFYGTVTLMPLTTPTDKNQCKHGGWKDYVGPDGPFKNQGDCIQFVNTGK